MLTGIAVSKTWEKVRIKIKCRDHTKILADRLFEIGDKLFRIKITVEPESLCEEDDLLDEDPNHDKAEAQEGGGAPTSGPGSTTLTPSANPSTGNTTSSEASGSKTSSSRQAAIEMLQQMQHPHSENFCLLREMELAEDDMSTDSELGSEELSDNEEVIFSPVTGCLHQNPNITALDHTLQDQPPTQPPTQKNASIWGPVHASRKSNRVEVGGRTMLGIAVDKKKVANLEAPKGIVKGTILKKLF